MAEFRLKYAITADNRAALTSIKEVDNSIQKIGGGTPFSSVAAGLNSIGGPAAVAQTAITGIGTALVAVGAAAVTAGVAIYNITKTAAEFGSEMFDASKKTGLHAETLSAMKFAADQSGSSLGQVTGAIAKFAKQVGAAAAGSKEAQAALKALGIDPQEALSDLDGALAKVFKRIQDAKPGVEQMTLAQKAFGKSGADLLPFIDSFDGDLEKLRKTTDRLGLTVGDDAARKFDEFGDSLDTVNAQIDGLGRQIGVIFVPIFTDMAKALSEFLIENRENFESWANTAKQAILGVSQTFGAFEDRLEEFRQRTGKSWDDIAIDMLDKTGPLMIRMKELQRLIGGAATGGVGYVSGAAREGGGYAGVPVGDIVGSRGRGGRSNADSEARRLQREAEEAERNRIRAARQSYEFETQFFEAEASKRFAIVEQFADKEKKTAADVARFQEFLAVDVLEFKKRKLDEYISKLVTGTEEYIQAQQEMRLIELDIETQRAKNATAESNRVKKATEEEKKLHDDRRKRWSDHIKYLIEVQEREDAERERAANERAEIARRRAESSMATAQGTLTGGIASGLGVGLVPMFDSATNAMLSFQERMNLVRADINTFTGEAIGGMIQALGQMAASWLATGEFSAQAALQMLASVAFSIASQAALKAVFEAAEAVAAAARWDFVAASLHSTAASMYATVAVIAGGAGIGLALASRAVGGKKDSARGGSSSASASSGGRQSSGSQTPISRVSPDAFVSGRNSEILILASAVDKLQARITGMRPGDVVAAGVNQRPGLVGNAMVSDVKRNASIGTSLRRATGER